MTTEEHKRARFQGKAFLEVWIANQVRAGLPVELAESAVAGAVEGARDFVAAYVSDRAAYDMLQHAADRAGSRLVAGDAPPFLPENGSAA